MVPSGTVPIIFAFSMASSPKLVTSMLYCMYSPSYTISPCAKVFSPFLGTTSNFNSWVCSLFSCSISFALLSFFSIFSSR